MCLARLENGNNAAAMAVTPNTEKISRAVTDRPCMCSFCQNTYRAIRPSPRSRQRRSS